MTNKSKKTEVRVRMAPSPTGLMHIGTLRTVLYDDLFARQNGGKLILRVEDTDQSREVYGAVENLLSMLKFVGIEPDEGPYWDGDKVSERGEFGPYTQSKRLPIDKFYKEHVEKLLENGHAYHCFCTSQRLDEMRAQQQRHKQPPMYDRTCLDLEKQEVATRIEKGEKHVVRMKVPRGEKVQVEDIVRGRVTFQTDTVDDQVIMKSDGFPTYHLAVVVDDHLMQISHVIRGEEWLPSTPKHIILYNMFGWELPEFAHLPLLLNADKTKLSKRQGDVAVEDYLNKGYLKEALINFVAFLGWNPGGGETREIYTHDELIKIFRLDKVHKAGAVVDQKKLAKINAHYIKEMNTESLYVELLLQRGEHLKQLFERYPEAAVEGDAQREFLMRVLEVEKERMEKLIDFGTENTFFFEEIVLDKDLLTWKENTDEQTAEALGKAHDVLSSIDDADWQRENLASVLMQAAGEDRGSFLWPLRAALTAQKRSPSPMDCAWVLGKEKTLERVEVAQKSLA